MEDGSGGFHNAATVTFDLIAPINTVLTDAQRMMLRQQKSAVTAGTGAFSIVLARTDALTPDGTVWRVECVVAKFLKYIATDAASVDVVTALDLAGTAGEFASLDSALTTLYAFCAALPTEDPLVAGRPFINGGVIMRSAGP